MESVGVRELKNRLAYYLRIVRQGKTVVVTTHGKPVARLTPISTQWKTALPPDLEERMWELVAEGLVNWSGKASQVPEPVAVNRGPELISDLVVKDRE